MNHKKELVREFIIPDGIGAQLLRKIHAMSYALHNELLFQDIPITDFLIHESDKVESDQDKQNIISQLTGIINNPWSFLNFSNQDDYVISKKVGEGLPESQGMANIAEGFTKKAIFFNTIDESENNVVIHIRRGNVIRENPRWIDESVYCNMLEQLPSTLTSLGFAPDRVIVLTDAPDKEKLYKPISDNESYKWRQPFLNPNENGEFVTTSLDFDMLRASYPGLEFINNLSTYDSFLLMLKAKLLIPSRSAFSQVAALLSKNNTLEMFSSHNGFATAVGYVDSLGNISRYTD
jgi:hypothetical protein